MRAAFAFEMVFRSTTPTLCYSCATLKLGASFCAPARMLYRRARQLGPAARAGNNTGCLCAGHTRAAHDALTTPSRACCQD